MAQTLSNESGVKYEFTWGVGLRSEGVVLTKRSRSVNTMPISERSKKWIDSLVGLFDNNPRYMDILENEAKARRLMDERFIEPE